MRIPARIKFRIEVAENVLGFRIYYPQVSYYRIGIIPRRHWIGIGVDIGFNESFNMDKKYTLIQRDMGFKQLIEAERVISMWSKHLKEKKNIKLKKTNFIYY